VNAQRTSWVERLSLHAPPTPITLVGVSDAAPPRSLRALGFDGVPVREPLLYPGRLVEGPTLLSDARLLELGVAGDRLGAWPVLPHEGRHVPCAPGARGDPSSGRSRTVPCAPGARGDPSSGRSRAVPVLLDALLDGLGLPRTGDRHPVLAVGSNAAPGQLSHKLTRRGVSDTVPLVPATVRGVSVALSAHVSAPGYVAATPVVDPGAESPLVLTLLDDAQLAAVDATEPNYRRTFLPGDDFLITLPSGRRLGGAYVYHSTRGVLAAPGGAGRAGGPRPAGAQPEVLAALLADSPRLHALLGPSPQDWVRRAAADEALRAHAAELFVAEGWLLPDDGFARYAAAPDTAIRYRDLPDLSS
jgi:hypothetical protein